MGESTTPASCEVPDSERSQVREDMGASPPLQEMEESDSCQCSMEAELAFDGTRCDSRGTEGQSWHQCDECQRPLLSTTFYVELFGNYDSSTDVRSLGPVVPDRICEMFAESLKARRDRLFPGGDIWDEEPIRLSGSVFTRHANLQNNGVVRYRFLIVFPRSVSWAHAYQVLFFDGEEQFIFHPQGDCRLYVETEWSSGVGGDTLDEFLACRAEQIRLGHTDMVYQSEVNGGIALEYSGFFNVKAWPSFDESHVKRVDASFLGESWDGIYAAAYVPFLPALRN